MFAILLIGNKAMTTFLNENTCNRIEFWRKVESKITNARCL